LNADKKVTITNDSTAVDMHKHTGHKHADKGFLMTSHALERSQQRCIPPLIIQWLCHYGSRKRSRNGTTLCYFDRKSVRLIASDAGHIIVRRLSSLMNSYLVIAGNRILTVGHRYKRIKN